MVVSVYRACISYAYLYCTILKGVSHRHCDFIGFNLSLKFSHQGGQAQWIIMVRKEGRSLYWLQELEDGEFPGNHYLEKANMVEHLMVRCQLTCDKLYNPFIWLYTWWISMTWYQSRFWISKALIWNPNHLEVIKQGCFMKRYAGSVVMGTRAP